MHLRAKSRHFLRHFPRRADGKYVNQLHQIIKEFEISEKIYFRFISDRQTGKSTNKQKRLGNSAKKRRVLHLI